MEEVERLLAVAGDESQFHERRVQGARFTTESKIQGI